MAEPDTVRDEPASQAADAAAGDQPAPQAGVATLVVASGPLTGQRVPVQAPVEIGREAAGIGLPFDAQASRRHAVVSISAGGLQISDLGSTNGTFVNGQRVQSAMLKQGDTVTVGSTQIRVE